MSRSTAHSPEGFFKKGREGEGGIRECRVIDAYLKDGWEVITRGMPTFLARKPGQPFRAVWVER